MATETARAKVNLYLHVTGRREDGYHLLDSLAVFPAIGDTLSLVAGSLVAGSLVPGSLERAAPDLRLDGPFGTALAADADNLILRARRMFAEATGHGDDAGFRLVKRLPLASGIGGGSADAAAALRLLARHACVAVPPALPLALGADVPVCLASRPARMGGIGEILDAAPALPEFGLVLANPGVTVATAAIFRARRGDFSAPAILPAAWSDAAAMASDLASFGNDLEAPAMALEPAIGEVLAALRALPGCLLARMSGSGATCFGMFATAREAAQAAAELARPGWWTWGGAGQDDVRDIDRHGAAEAAPETDIAVG